MGFQGVPSRKDGLGASLGSHVFLSWLCDRVGTIGGEILEFLKCASRPLNLEKGHSFVRAQTKMSAFVVGRKVSRSGSDFADLATVGRGGEDRGPDALPVGRGAPKSHPDRVAAQAVVAEEVE